MRTEDRITREHRVGEKLGLARHGIVSGIFRDSDAGFTEPRAGVQG